MNWTIYIVECCVLIFLFTGSIMIPLTRNPIWWIHDSAPVLLKKSFALLLALAV